MFRHTLILTLTACLALAHSLPRNRKSDAEAEAAKNAHYFFSSDVEDQVNDLTQHREEVRDGLKVRGSFSYSDGFLRRHVVYEADQDGYRVIQDKIEPLPGPKINPEGRTLVSSILLATSVSGQFTPSPIDKFRTGGNLNQQSLRIPIRVQNELAPAVAGPTVHNPRQVGTFVQPLRQTLPQQNLQPTLTFPQSSQIRTTLLQQSSGTRPVTVPSSQPVNGVPIPVQNDFAPTVSIPTVQNPRQVGTFAQPLRHPIPQQNLQPKLAFPQSSQTRTTLIQQPSGTQPVTVPNSQPVNDVPITVQNDFAPTVSIPTVHNPRQVGTFAQPLRHPIPQQNLQPTLTFPQRSQIRTTLLQQPSGTRPVTTPNSQPANDAQAQEDVTQSPEQILFQEQAENAKYSFDAAITDNIMDHSHVRKESRDGLAVSGLYSYSDGYYKRTVHYRADENGYRVTKEEVEPIGEGPQVNLDGDAVVSTNVGGVDNKYRITAADIAQWQRNPES